MPPWRLRADRPSGPVTTTLYPGYETTAAILAERGIPADFQSDGPVRYSHRRTGRRDIYFVANTTGETVKARCDFRAPRGDPQLWDPVTAAIRALPQFERREKVTAVPLTFEPYQSFFVVFPPHGPVKGAGIRGWREFPRNGARCNAGRRLGSRF